MPLPGFYSQKCAIGVQRIEIKRPSSLWHKVRLTIGDETVNNSSRFVFGSNYLCWDFEPPRLIPEGTPVRVLSKSRTFGWERSLEATLPYKYVTGCMKRGIMEHEYGDGKTTIMVIIGTDVIDGAEDALDVSIKCKRALDHLAQCKELYTFLFQNPCDVLVGVSSAASTISHYLTSIYEVLERQTVDDDVILDFVRDMCITLAYTVDVGRVVSPPRFKQEVEEANYLVKEAAELIGRWDTTDEVVSRYLLAHVHALKAKFTEFGDRLNPNILRAERLTVQIKRLSLTQDNSDYLEGLKLK